MIQAYPKPDADKKDPCAEENLAWLKAIVNTLRTLRSEMNIAPGKKIPLLFYKGNAKDRENSQLFLNEIINLAKITSLKWINEEEKIATSAMALVGNLELLIPMEGLIDTKAEIQRLEKEILKIEKEIERAQSKLANAAFVKKAPADIIAQERQRLSDFTATHTKLQQQLVLLKNT